MELRRSPRVLDGGEKAAGTSSTIAVARDRPDVSGTKRLDASSAATSLAASSEDEPGVDLSKLARPTSTWTYMVHDNPLNDDTLSALSLPGVFR